MGYPESIVDRQLDRGTGDWPHRVRVVRRAQNFMLAAALINLVGVVGLNLVTGLYDRRISVALGALWLGLAHMAFRQRTHLDRRAGEPAG